MRSSTHPSPHPCRPSACLFPSPWTATASSCRSDLYCGSCSFFCRSCAGCCSDFAAALDSGSCVCSGCDSSSCPSHGPFCSCFYFAAPCFHSCSSYPWNGSGYAVSFCVLHPRPFLDSLIVAPASCCLFRHPCCCPARPCLTSRSSCRPYCFLHQILPHFKKVRARCNACIDQCACSWISYAEVKTYLALPWSPFEANVRQSPLPDESDQPQ
jgi:hypothetical protein